MLVHARTGTKGPTVPRPAELQVVKADGHPVSARKRPSARLGLMSSTLCQWPHWQPPADSAGTGIGRHLLIPYRRAAAGGPGAACLAFLRLSLWDMRSKWRT
jgi:hypothetical protein